MHNASQRRPSRLWASVLVTLAALATPAWAQEDVLGVPGPLSFQDTSFALAWSGQTDVEAVHEYIPAGQTLESYAEMFIIRTATNGTTPLALAQAMTAGLDERKTAGDPVVNYDLIQNEATGEVLLDFLISDSSTGTVVVEWNAYRYVPLENGVATYAISRRGYGDDGAKAFLTELKDWRQNTISALAEMDVPEVTVSN